MKYEFVEAAVPPHAPPPEVERRVVKTSNVITGQSDKMRATHILWYNRGYGHNTGADKKNALKIIKLFTQVWHIKPEEVINYLEVIKEK